MGNVLKEICLITGLKVDDGTGKEFTKMFSKFIREHYTHLSPAEITLAFTLNAAAELPGTSGGKDTDKIEFYGSFLTLEHIGSILFRYMQKRGNLAKKLREEDNLQLEAPIPTKEEQEMEDKKFANEYYRKYIANEFSTVSLEYAHWVYDTLDKFDLIVYTVEQKKVYMSEATQIRERQLMVAPADFQEHKNWNRLLKAYTEGMLPDEEKKVVINYAKRLALIDLFKTWKMDGKKRIFE